jgi:NAD(P)H-dependent FMN reductase
MVASDQQTNLVRVVGLCGSLRPGGHTRKVVNLALAGAREVGAEVALLDLVDYELVFCDARDDESTYPADVHRLRAEVAAADGIILGTPEYHGGVSGVLKNALDLMGFSEFGGKMIGLVGVSGGDMGATSSLSNLRTIGRSLRAWVVPDEVSVASAGRAFDADGTVKDPKLAGRVRNVGAQVARFAFLHSSDHPREFMRLWEESQANPGGD